MRFARFSATMAALFLVGCGGSTANVKPIVNDEITGWNVQVSRWIDWQNTWEIVLPGTGALYAGDQIDIDLTYGKVLGRSRGGYDLVKTVKLPDGSTVGNEVFGKGGYVLSQVGEYTFAVTASAAGQPHASLTVKVEKHQSWVPFDLIPTVDSITPLQHEVKTDGQTWFTGSVDQLIHFTLDTYGSMRGRGGLPMGETMLSIIAYETGLETDWDQSPSDRFSAAIHQPGKYYANMMFGTDGHGGYANIATCHLIIQ